MKKFILTLMMFFSLQSFAETPRYIQPLFKPSEMRVGLLIPFRVADEKNNVLKIDQVVLSVDKTDCVSLIDPFQDGIFFVRCFQAKEFNLVVSFKHASLGKLKVQLGPLSIYPLTAVPILGGGGGTSTGSGTSPVPPSSTASEGQILHEQNACASCHTTKWGASKAAVSGAINQIGQMKNYNNGQLLKLSSSDLDKITAYLASGK